MRTIARTLSTSAVLASALALGATSTGLAHVEHHDYHTPHRTRRHAVLGIDTTEEH